MQENYPKITFHATSEFKVWAFSIDFNIVDSFIGHAK
jgi:hypothetical protein